MRLKNLSTLLLFLSLFISFASCHNYYKAMSFTQQSNPRLGAKLDSLNTANKYLILHNGSAAVYQISNLKINGGQNAAFLSLAPVDAMHQLHAAGNPGMRYRKLKSAERSVVNEVHVYMPFDAATKTGTYSLPLSNVEKIEVLKHDSKRSTNSHILGAGLIVGGVAVALIAAVVIAYSGSSWH